MIGLAIFVSVWGKSRRTTCEPFRFTGRFRGATDWQDLGGRVDLGGHSGRPPCTTTHRRTCEIKCGTRVAKPSRPLRTRFRQTPGPPCGQYSPEFPDNEQATPNSHESYRSGFSGRPLPPIENELGMPNENRPKTHSATTNSSLARDFISMEALYQAYKKAKVDIFWEKSQPLSKRFCDYEQNLHGNLTTLQNILTQPGTEWFKSLDFIGGYGFIPKGLQIPNPGDDQEGVAHFSASDPDDAWELLLKSLKDTKPKAEFRPVALFTVPMCVVCALWVNLVGHLFDACLDISARGSRLRRLKHRADELPRCGRYHLTAPGSFKPYFKCYDEWRQLGLRAIRRELDENRRVVAVTMDLQKFYHNIDPRFILRDDFLTAIRLQDVSGRSLLEGERIFTEQLVTAFVTWGNALPKPNSDGPPGIPVGVSAPRVMANVLLAEFDRLVQENLDPIYYSRYVDDIFLVLRDNGKLRSSQAVLKHLCQRIEPLTAKEDLLELTLSFSYSNDCRLVFQARKQRIFLLSGEVGVDLIETIESQIREVSSESRLLPDLDALETSHAARTLTASDRAAETADTLRKADKLTLKRLSFSIMLRQYDILAHDLPPDEWKRERHRFFRFAERNVLTAMRLLDLNDHLPRLLGLAVACQDWPDAQRFLRLIKKEIKRLRENVTVEPEADADKQWDGYLRHLQLALREAVIRAYPLDETQPKNDTGARSLFNAIDALSSTTGLESWDIPALSSSFFWSDLGRIPLKNGLLAYDRRPHPILKDWEGDLPKTQKERLDVIQKFLSENESNDVPAHSLLFPTRPFSVSEVTEFDSRCAKELERLREYVVALRGIWVKPLVESSLGPEPEAVIVGEDKLKRSPRIAVTSFLTEDASWSKAAEGGSDLSAGRYKRLIRLSNAIVKSPNRANYVVFPELSIPRRWLPGLTGLFTKAGLSLIAGVEYRRTQSSSGPEVINEAYLVLSDNRLGYQSWTVLRQRKCVPAHHERNELRCRFGLSLQADVSGTDQTRIYRHLGHDFGVLICSELTDIRFRMQMRGKVDTLFVLSWNQDLDSFEALMDAAVLDVHCYIVLVNNRMFGDSRVRTPSKKSWRRDLIRIKGGLEDYFVVTDLDIPSLRNFQSFHEPPLGDHALFKPTPEGFEISDHRRQTPSGDS